MTRPLTVAPVTPVNLPAPLLPPEDSRDEEALDLRQYWRTIDKYKWGILVLVAVVGLITGAVVWRIQPIYRATATLLIEPKATKFVNLQDVFDAEYEGFQYYQTQYQILGSRTLAEKVVDRYELWKAPVFDRSDRTGGNLLRIDWRRWIPAGWLPIGQAPNTEQPAPTEAQRKAAAAATLLGGVEIEPIEHSQLVRIHFHSPDPQFAATAANALANGYIESILDARFQMTQKASEWLSERLGDLRTKLDASEKALQDYRDHEGLVDISGVRTLAVGDLDSIRQRLEEARQRRAQLADTITQLRSGGGLITDSSEAPGAMELPLVAELRSQESEAKRDIEELSKRYGPKHPKMIAAQAKLEAIRANLQKEVGAGVTGLRNELRMAEANVVDLEQKFAQAKGSVQSVNRKEFEIQKLQRDVEANRQLYDMFMTRAKETNIGGTDVETANARVVDPAISPGAPYEPDKTRILSIALLLALVAGIGLAFLLERLDNTLKTSDDVEQRLQQPALGLLPAVKTRGKSAELPQRMFLEDRQSPFAEAIRTVRTSVLLSGLDNPHKLVLVTSSLVGEGKTTVAMNLAFALGHLEKVLLIEADMRRPSVAALLHLGADAPGLSNLIAGTSSPSDCIHKVEDTNVHVVPAGLVPPNPLEMLSSQKLALLLEKLGSIYERIVVDTAPTQAVSDALVLSRHANAVVYVVRGDATPYPIARAGIKRLHQANAPVIGVVLNRLDVRKMAKYGKYGYYGDYYGHYGYYQRAS